jgi:hypothetical protein
VIKILTKEKTMMWTEFSIWVLLIAAVIQMGGGMLWYGPVCGNAWLKAMGLDPTDKEKMAEMQRSAGPAYGASLVFSVIFGYVLDVLFNSIGVTSMLSAILLVWVLWFALTFANTTKAVLWGEMNRNVLLINSGFELLLFTGVAIAAYLL